MPPLPCPRTLGQLGQRLPRVRRVLRHVDLQAREVGGHGGALPLVALMRCADGGHQLTDGPLRRLIGGLQLPQVRHARLHLCLKVLQQLALVAVRPPIQQLCGGGRRGQLGGEC